MRELVPRFDMHDPTSAAVPGPVPKSRRRVFPVHRYIGRSRPAAAKGVLF
ncbi:hypothetical protein [Nocardia jinanensis]|nr:hypothetical protein [Nocardia jinanensis]